MEVLRRKVVESKRECPVDPVRGDRPDDRYESQSELPEAGGAQSTDHRLGQLLGFGTILVKVLLIGSLPSPAVQHAFEVVAGIDLDTGLKADLPAPVPQRFQRSGRTSPRAP